MLKASDIAISVEPVVSERFDYRITARHPNLYTEPSTFVSGGQITVDHTAARLRAELTAIIEQMNEKRTA